MLIVCVDADCTADDPEFPGHRGNHRAYLSDSTKFKEVVHFEHTEIRKKIHYTYRLLYLKDVVLARILDDPTFSVLNSLIFFHQVDIVNHIQANQAFLKELFSIFHDDQKDAERKKLAVLFIQNCCTVAKNIQPPSRAALYQNFLAHGLFGVITFSLRHHDAAVRVAGTEVLMCLIDHDAPMVRASIARAINEKTVPLTDTLIDLLLLEMDLGVKSQMAEAIKVLLDSSPVNAGLAQTTDFVAKQRGEQGHGRPLPTQANQFIQTFYDDGAKRLFQPLKDLENRQSMAGLTVQETSLYTHLVEVLQFFVRQHAYQSKLFILAENLHSRIAQLLECPQKYMKLIALKWFRTCIGLQDEFHNRQIIQHRLFEPILNIVYETMPRDNLLNSACLEMFEYIKREGIKQLINHLAQNYRERLMGITYVNTFQAVVQKYEQLQHPYIAPNGEGDASFTTEPDTPDALKARQTNGRQIFSGLKEDADEDAYFNNDDDMDGDLGDDDLPTAPMMLESQRRLPNGHASPAKPLVDYPDDDDEDQMDILASSPDPIARKEKISTPEQNHNTTRGRSRHPVAVDGSPGTQQSPPESIAMKRRREEEDEDELGKMMGSGTKRRNSSASLSGGTKNNGSSQHIENAGVSPVSSQDENLAPSPTAVSPKFQATSPNDSPAAAAAGTPQQHTPNHSLRRKGSLKVKNEGPANPGRFAIKPINLSGGRGGAAAEDGEKNGDANGGSG